MNHLKEIKRIKRYKKKKKDIQMQKKGTYIKYTFIVISL